MIRNALAARLDFEIPTEKAKVQNLKLSSKSSSICGAVIDSNSLGQLFRAAALIESPSEGLYEATFNYLKKGAAGRAAVRAQGFLLLRKRTRYTDPIFKDLNKPPYFLKSLLKMNLSLNTVTLNGSSDPWYLEDQTFDHQSLYRVRDHYPDFFDESKVTLLKKRKVDASMIQMKAKSLKRMGKGLLKIYDAAPGHEESESFTIVPKKVRSGLNQKKVDRMSSKEKCELIS